MEATINKQSIKQDLTILLAALTITFAALWYAASPRYLPASKIEEGTVAVKNDSVTTIIIPDKRLK